MTTRRTRTVGLLLFPGFEPLDAFGPVEAFVISEWPGARLDSPRPFKLVTVAAQAEAVAMRGGTLVLPDCDVASCPALDVLLVPGGTGTRTEYRNRELLDFIAARAPSLEVLASVCTGAALLGAAGVAGRAAGHHQPPRLRLGGLGLTAERALGPGEPLGRRRPRGDLGRGLGRDRHGAPPGGAAGRPRGRGRGGAAHGVPLGALPGGPLASSSRRAPRAPSSPASRG